MKNVDKNFCASKDSIKKVKQTNKQKNYRVGKIFSNLLSGKGLLSILHKELQLLNNKTNNPRCLEKQLAKLGEELG